MITLDNEGPASEQSHVQSAFAPKVKIHSEEDSAIWHNKYVYFQQLT